MTHIPGLHHVTAITGSAQSNADFYTGALKQRLVKKTVNFDDPGTWHLYYGDRTGSPGTILTYFPFAGVGPGKPGPGMASAFAYAVPDLAAAAESLRAKGHTVTPTEDRFGEKLATLRDSDGAVVELVEQAGADGHGFHSVTLWLNDPDRTARLLTDVFGWQAAGHDVRQGRERLRFRAPGNERGNVVDLIRVDGAARGWQGAGSIHHVAFRARSPEEQLDWQARLGAAGHRTTPVIDRQYFDAIYFREPGGVLFEIATDPPGFAVDEPVETLGTTLKLPPQYEGMRDRIERTLPPLRVAS